jgi:hypothetical protein
MSHSTSEIAFPRVANKPITELISLENQVIVVTGAEILVDGGEVYSQQESFANEHKYSSSFQTRYRCCCEV